jgi:hypothetical protein
VTDEPMDYRDWLIRQQQERIARRFDALFTKDEDHAAAATQGIENQACYEAQEAAAVYDYVQESLTDVITQARDLRARIHSGTEPEKDARSCSPTCASSAPSWSPRSLRPRAGMTARRPP